MNSSVAMCPLVMFPCSCNSYNVSVHIFIAIAVKRVVENLSTAWFLEIDFFHDMCMCVCLSVSTPRLLIHSGMICTLYD